MSTSTRWTVAVAVVVLGLIAGLLVELRRPGPAAVTGPVGAQRGTESSTGADSAAGTGSALADSRRRADLPPCSPGPDADGPAALRGITVECAADGAPVDAAGMLAGRRVVVNLWAYWCAPCRHELPAMAEYQRMAGPAVTVVTVHQDHNEAAALALLTELGVRLPTLQDGARRIAAGLRVPNVMPATVVLTAGGSVARILPRAFSSAAEIAAAVGDRE